MSTGSINISKAKRGITGLVVCGGKSTRMGTDKSMLIYHDLPERYRLYNILLPFSDEVFISCNVSQQHEIPVGFNTITDLPIYENAGPAAAVLTAFSVFPNTDLLVVGCDYPYLKDIDVAELLWTASGRETTAFFNTAASVYEPLLGLYSHNDADMLLELFESSQSSLQRFLQLISASKHFPRNDSVIKSADTINDYKKIKHSLQAKQ